MKKTILLLTILSASPIYANPLFYSDTQNSLGIYISQSSGFGNLGHLISPFEWNITPMSNIMLQYSQPIKILRLPARINLHLLQNIAYRSTNGASFGAVGISWDIALFNWCDWYFGIGIGPYMRDSGDQYVQSRLVFGEKVFIGTKIAKHLNAEFFTLHFSNGDFTDTNRGINYIGFGLNYSF